MPHKLNWTEIEARYKSGEEPRYIAEDYLNCTAEQIHQKVKREGWKKEKDRIRQEIAADSEKMVKALALTTLNINLRLMNLIDELLDAPDYQLSLTDGRPMNSLLKIALMQSTKLTSQYIARQHKESLNNSEDNDFQTFTLNIVRQGPEKEEEDSD